MCKNRVIYGFLNTSWVLINMAPRNKSPKIKLEWLTKKSNHVVTKNRAILYSQETP